MNIWMTIFHNRRACTLAFVEKGPPVSAATTPKRTTGSVLGRAGRP
jgi:hypothetical protein